MAGRTRVRPAEFRRSSEVRRMCRAISTPRTIVVETLHGGGSRAVPLSLPLPRGVLRERHYFRLLPVEGEEDDDDNQGAVTGAPHNGLTLLAANAPPVNGDNEAAPVAPAAASPPAPADD